MNMSGVVSVYENQLGTSMMAVSPSSIFAFLLVAHLVILNFAADSEKYQPNCPDCFNSSCESTTRKIWLPFTNGTHTGCGLSTVNCSGGVPKIQLAGGQQWYEVKDIRDESIVISPRNPRSSRSCELFNYLLPHPCTPSVSFEILYPPSVPSTTFLECSSRDELGQQITDYFDHSNYSQYQDCRGFTVYYRYPPPAPPPPNGTPPTPPNGCIEIRLPTLPSTDKTNAGDVFSILDYCFSIRVVVSEQCRECRDGRGQCIKDLQESHCSKDGNFPPPSKITRGPAPPLNAGTNRWKLILGIALPGGFISLLCLFVLAFRLRRKGIHQFWYTRNTISSDPSSRTTDLEGGSIFFGIPIFSYSELEAATDNFDPSKELGDGGFGVVYHGKLRDGREVAVKRLFERNYKQVLTQFTNEIQILTCLRHPNLVSLYGCTSRHCRELLLVYEYVPNGTVADHLCGDKAKDGSLTWPIRMNIAIETASALTYLHASEIIHRDVKTNNILLDNNFKVKVADFGLSRLFPRNVTHVSTAPQGTPGYVDPEYRQCYQLTSKSDVYSFGVVLVELVSSMPAVDLTRHGDEIKLANLAMNRIQNRAFDELMDPSIGFRSDSSVERMATSVAEVAFRCLQLEREMRPTMDEVLEALKEIHNYNKEIDDNVGVVLGKDDDHKVMPNNSLDSVNLDGLVSLPNLPRPFPVVKPTFRSA